MQQINYGIYCEDPPQRIFIKNVLPQIVHFSGISDELKVVQNSEFKKTFGKHSISKKKVKKTYPIALTQGFSKYKLDLCFIGFDFDTNDKTKYENEIKNFYQELYTKFANHHDKIILFVPVQCIEHWLWYLSYHIKNRIVQRILTWNRNLIKKPN